MDKKRINQEDILRKQEELKQKLLEIYKKDAYECAQENKYGALRYIKP